MIIIIKSMIFILLTEAGLTAEANLHIRIQSVLYVTTKTEL